MDEQKQSSSQVFYRIVPETDKNILVTDFFYLSSCNPRRAPVSVKDSHTVTFLQILLNF